MKNKLISCLLLSWFFTFSVFAQNVNPLIKNDFPNSWVGDWVGELMIYNANGLQQILPMQLIINPLGDTTDFTFTIIYGLDVETGTRSYILETIDAEKGQYRINEQNSIKIDAYLLGDKLVQRFEVMGNLLDTFIEKKGEHLIWEIFSGKMQGNITGDTVHQGDTIPPVQTFPMRVYQKCVLSKI